jgi:hypothetical protein
MKWWVIFFFVLIRDRPFLVKLICSKNSRLTEYQPAVGVVDKAPKEVWLLGGKSELFQWEKSRRAVWWNSQKILSSLDLVGSLDPTVFIHFHFMRRLELLVMSNWLIIRSPKSEHGLGFPSNAEYFIGTGIMFNVEKKFEKIVGAYETNVWVVRIWDSWTLGKTTAKSYFSGKKG